MSPHDASVRVSAWRGQPKPTYVSHVSPSLSLSLCVCVCVCMRSLSLSLSLCVCVYAFCVCVRARAFSLSLSLSLSVCVCVCVCVCACVCPYVVRVCVCIPSPLKRAAMRRLVQLLNPLEFMTQRFNVYKRVSIVCSFEVRSRLTVQGKGHLARVHLARQ